MATTKVCSHCHIEKPISEFGRESLRPDGLKPWCKACRKIEGAADFQKHKAKRTAKHKEWLKAHPGAQNDYVKAYQRRNPEKTKANNRTQNLKRDPEKHRADSRAYYWRRKWQSSKPGV